MSTDPRDSARTTEDVHFQAVGPAPESYPDTTGGPVEFVEVAAAQEVLGYLWAAEDGEAAGFIERAAAGDDAVNESIAWVRELRAAKAEGIPAARLLTEFTQTPLPKDPQARHQGRIIAGSRAHASGLAVLRSLATR